MYDTIMNELEQKAFDSILHPNAAHDAGHLKRVAIYASELVDIMGGTEREKELTYIAGLFHDVIRYPTKGHDQRSAEETKRILPEYGFKSEDIDAIYDAIKDHNELPVWGENKLADAIVLADKLFEANGAYICFRRAMFMAQTSDEIRQKQTAIDATLDESKVRMENFNASKYPLQFQELAYSQQKWQEEFKDALEKKDDWAVHLTKTMYAFGKGTAGLNEAIMQYEPKYELDKLFKEEAVKYIKGEKTNEFMALINKE